MEEPPSDHVAEENDGAKQDASQQDAKKKMPKYGSFINGKLEALNMSKFNNPWPQCEPLRMRVVPIPVDKKKTKLRTERLLEKPMTLNTFGTIRPGPTCYFGLMRRCELATFSHDFAKQVASAPP